MEWGAPVIFLSLVAGGTTLALGEFARRRDELGSVAFAAMMYGASLWSLTYAVALAAPDSMTRETFEVPLEVAKAIVAPSWLIFALQYTGRGEYVTRRFVAILLVLPAVTLGLVLTNDVHHLVWSDYRIVPTWGASTVLYDPGPWHWVHAAYGWLLVGGGVLLIFGLVFARDTLYREQAVALVVGSVVPTIAQVKWTFSLPPVPALDLTPLSLAVTGVTFGYALFRFELFGLSPAVGHLGRRAALDDVGVGVVIVNREGRVVELNDEGENVLGVDEATASGTGLSALLPEDEFELGTKRQTVTVDRPERRIYEVTSSPIQDQHDDTLGYTVVFSDVTLRVRQRQRVEVLNRVLRHNLRNDMSVVLGYAELLEDRVDPEDHQMVEAIVRQSRELVQLGEKARDVEKVLDADTTPRRFDAAEATRSVVQRVHDEADAGVVDLDVPESLSFAGVPPAYETVVSNLVENALEHGGPDPHVSVCLDATGDDALLVVADDGPGIPEHEVSVLESGDETPLEHGSGLGLWAVHWAVAVLGGDVTIETPQAGGTTVRVRFRSVIAGPTD